MPHSTEVTVRPVFLRLTMAIRMNYAWRDSDSNAAGGGLARPDGPRPGLTRPVRNGPLMMGQTRQVL